MNEQLYNYHLALLDDRLELRKRNNSQYSFRAYSRDLKFDPSTLRKIMHSQRPFPLSASERVARSLKFSSIEYRKFVKSVISQKGIGVFPRLDKPLAYELDNRIHQKIIAEWEYFALLNFFKVKDFFFDDLWVAERLGITKRRASEIMNNLIRSGLVQLKNNKWQRTKKRLKTTDMISSCDLRKSHLQELELAKKTIINSLLDDFDCYSMVYPTNTDMLKKARKLTRDFFEKMEDILEVGDRTEVYQMSLQLFPLTKLKKCLSDEVGQ